MQVYAVHYVDKEPKTILFSNMDAATAFMKYLLDNNGEGSFAAYPVYETFGEKQQEEIPLEDAKIEEVKDDEE